MKVICSLTAIEFCELSRFKNTSEVIMNHIFLNKLRLLIALSALLWACLIQAADSEKIAPTAPKKTVAQADKPKEEELKKQEREPDVIYVPTPQTVVDKMLDMAQIKKGDVLYDLGCGDGRIMVTAAKKYGIKATGFDINPERVKEARENVRTNKVAHLVTIKQADIFKVDLREASVVTLYLLPELNVKLMPQLALLKSGSRILSHDFDMEGAKSVERVEVNGELDTLNDSNHIIYKWIVPWEKEQ